MTAEGLLRTLENDHAARLKWRVARLLGICPVSLRALLLTRRRTLYAACNLVLDAVPAAGEGRNPNFDEARFDALRGAE